jgi:hypothetical protein
MKALQLAIVAALAIHSTAYAQIGINPTAATRAFANRAMYSLVRPQTSVPVVGNSNECAPGAAVPVWRGNGELVGYSCAAASANGG